MALWICSYCSRKNVARDGMHVKMQMWLLRHANSRIVDGLEKGKCCDRMSKRAKWVLSTTNLRQLRNIVESTPSLEADHNEKGKRCWRGLSQRL